MFGMGRGDERERKLNAMELQYNQVFESSRLPRILHCIRALNELEHFKNYYTVDYVRKKCPLPLYVPHILCKCLNT